MRKSNDLYNEEAFVAMVAARILDVLLVFANVPEDHLAVDAAAGDDVRLGGREGERENVIGSFQKQLNK